MDKFYVLIAIIIVFIPSRIHMYTRLENNIKAYSYKAVDWSRIWIGFLSIVFLSGFRSGFIDTAAYRIMYERTGTNFQLALAQTDKGFFVFMSLLNHISENSQFLLLVSTVMITYFILATLIKYSPDLKLSVFLYIAAGSYAVSMNGLRQFLAASIIFFALPLLLKRKRLAYFLVIVFASTFHSSAIFFLIVFLVENEKVFSKKIVFLLGFAVTFLLLTAQIAPFLFFMLQDSHFSIYAGDIISGVGGTGFLRVLVEAIPMFLALIIYVFTKSDLFHSNRLLKVTTNISVVNLTFYIVSLQSWILARVSMYFSLYNIILLPLLINHFTRGKSKLLVKLLFYYFYLIYFVYQMKFAYKIIDFPLRLELF